MTTVEQRIREIVAIEVTREVLAERARCAAVCREVAAGYDAEGYDAIDDGECGQRAAGALECAEAIERGAVER